MGPRFQVWNCGCLPAVHRSFLNRAVGVLPSERPGFSFCHRHLGALCPRTENSELQILRLDQHACLLGSLSPGDGGGRGPPECPTPHHIRWGWGQVFQLLCLIIVIVTIATGIIFSKRLSLLFMAVCGVLGKRHLKKKETDNIFLTFNLSWIEMLQEIRHFKENLSSCKTYGSA